MKLDEQAHEIALKSLSNGKFDWQAYLVLVASESRLQSVSEQPTEYAYGLDTALNEFQGASSERKTVVLQNLLDKEIATMSELLAMTDGDANYSVRLACEKIGHMA